MLALGEPRAIRFLHADDGGQPPAIALDDSADADDAEPPGRRATSARSA